MMKKQNKSQEDKQIELESLLQKASSLTKKEAKEILLKQVRSELNSEIAKKIREAKERIESEAKKQAQEIILDAMRHGATQYTAEYTVSSISVPDEEVKGRIIGAGGRNIRTFERATGVEIEIDESNEIKLSSFDSIRREIAKRALQELIKDSRIQPSRIEEVVERNKKEMEQILIEEGNKIAQECSVYKLPNDIIKLLGRFKFRTSYGQNLAQHTIEETKIGVSIAHELGSSVETVRLGALLHDIGKVVNDQEGTHVEIGVNVLKKYGFPREIVATVAEHHEDKPFSSIESIIVWTADAISGSRPGARYEPHEEYVKRMEKIEEIASSFEGVQQALAFQAGRDVRVVVNPEKVSDDDLVILVRDITKSLEKEAEYAGQIKVTAIREVRATDTTAAK